MNENTIENPFHLYYYYKYLFARKLRATLNLKNQKHHYLLGDKFIYEESFALPLKLILNLFLEINAIIFLRFGLIES
jgi:hypothetical protein